MRLFGVHGKLRRLDRATELVRFPLHILISSGKLNVSSLHALGMNLVYLYCPSTLAMRLALI